MGQTAPAAASGGNAGPTVLVASQDLLARWCARDTGPVDFLALADTDTEHAFRVIERRCPGFVVLEQRFAATGDGADMIRKLRSSPALRGLNLRVLRPERSATLGEATRVDRTLLAGLATPLPEDSRRHAERVTLPGGVEVFVDGIRTALVDVSAFGAQVVSTMMLRPNQRIRIAINRSAGIAATRAEISWCSMELGQQTAVYRAGVKFATAKPDFLDKALIPA